MIEMRQCMRPVYVQYWMIQKSLNTCFRFTQCSAFKSFQEPSHAICHSWFELNTQLLNTDPGCKLFGSSTFSLADLVSGTHRFSTPDSGFKFSFPRFSGSLARTTLVSHVWRIQKFGNLLLQCCRSVWDIISCSSISTWYNWVAQVLLPEWFVKFPSIPALPAISFTSPYNLLTPRTCSPYHKLAIPDTANGRR
jgi:hypothetical protein